MYTGSVHKNYKQQVEKETESSISIIEVKETKLAAFSHSNNAWRKENFRAGTDKRVKKNIADVSLN